MNDFHTTRWSLISQMRHGSDPDGARVALGELCQRCWFPIYAFVRRGGAAAHDAEDLTQGFFQHLLTHDLMTRAQRERGLRPKGPLSGHAARELCVVPNEVLQYSARASAQHIVDHHRGQDLRRKI